MAKLAAKINDNGRPVVYSAGIRDPEDSAELPAATGGKVTCTHRKERGVRRIHCSNGVTFITGEDGDYAVFGSNTRMSRYHVWRALATDEEKRAILYMCLVIVITLTTLTIGFQIGVNPLLVIVVTALAVLAIYMIALHIRDRLVGDEFSYILSSTPLRSLIARSNYTPFAVYDYLNDEFSEYAECYVKSLLGHKESTEKKNDIEKRTTALREKALTNLSNAYVSGEGSRT